MQISFTKNKDAFLFILTGIILTALGSCKSSTNNAGYGAMPPPALPVITVVSMPATTYQ